MVKSLQRCDGWDQGLVEFHTHAQSKSVLTRDEQTGLVNGFAQAMMTTNNRSFHE